MRGRIGRRNLAIVQIVALAQRRGELHAARDRMIEPDLDQPLAHRERNEALRGLARNAELARDLVLRVAGDVIEPAGARGVVEPRALAFSVPGHAGSVSTRLARPGRADSRMSSNMLARARVAASDGVVAPLACAPPVKPNTVMPARRAAVTPGALSSITRQRAGATPLRRGRDAERDPAPACRARPRRPRTRSARTDRHSRRSADEARMRSGELDEATQTRRAERASASRNSLDALQFALERARPSRARDRLEIRRATCAPSRARAISRIDALTDAEKQIAHLAPP